MRDKLIGIKERYEAIMEKLSAPGLDPSTMFKLNKERAQLETIVVAFDQQLAAEKELADNNELLKDADPDIKALANIKYP